MSVRIRCHVLEAPTHEWNSLTRCGHDRQSHREILPWADPYIAQLMQRLESRFDAEVSGGSNVISAADDSPWPAREWSGEWDGDDNGSTPEPFDGVSGHALPAVYGGWPLLNDVQDSNMQESYDGDSF